jgi:hypothetical protein
MRMHARVVMDRGVPGYGHIVGAVFLAPETILTVIRGNAARGQSLRGWHTNDSIKRAQGY